MRSIRTIMLSLVLVAGLSAVAAAQDRGGIYRGGVYQGQSGRQNGAYQQGWKDGQDDARHGRQSSTRVQKYENQADRDAWGQGYADGYQAWVRGEQGGGYYGQNSPNGGQYGRYPDRGNARGCVDRDNDGDCDRRDNGRHRGWGRGNENGRWGRNQGGYYGGNPGDYANGQQVARQYGFQDGARDGQNDRAGGHSFRPHEGRGYKLGTNGYQGQFGERDQYKQWYRSAYEQGYQQGYNGNGNRYRW